MWTFPFSGKGQHGGQTRKPMETLRGAEAAVKPQGSLVTSVLPHICDTKLAKSLFWLQAGCIFSLLGSAVDDE